MKDLNMWGWRFILEMPVQGFHQHFDVEERSSDQAWQHVKRQQNHHGNYKTTGNNLKPPQDHPKTTKTP